MPEANERNLGEQPLAGIMLDKALNAHDLVDASIEQITHKMVQRAHKGRRLTPRVQYKILNALNNATGENYTRTDLFTYA